MKYPPQTLKQIIQQTALPWFLAGLAGGFSLLAVGYFSDWYSARPALAFALACAGLVLMLIVLLKMRSMFQNQSLLAEERTALDEKVDQAYHRLEALAQIIQQFVEASDENQVIQPVLHYLVELSQADGASFVPLDEHGQPQAALSHGRLPFPKLNSWIELLATPQVRQGCRFCEKKQHDLVSKPENCPLLQGPFSESMGMVCLPVRRGEREFGVVNLFSAKPEGFDPHTLSFLNTVIEEMALGLDSVRLRRREFAALRQMQILRQQADLQTLLTGMLENARQTLEASCAMMIIPQSGDYQPALVIRQGIISAQAQAFAQGILQSVIASGEAVLLGSSAEFSADESALASRLKSVIAAPLRLPDHPIMGAILIGDQHARSFHQRQLVLLQTIAGQVALVVQNSTLMSELAYKTMIQERRRLAREIHDGLAQTLGFLKLQAAQMRGQFSKGEIERAGKSIDLIYATVSEAYQDARQAIDGLRISPAETGLTGWLEQSAQEFQELSGIPVNFQEIDVRIDLPSEIQAQLIRIVQEALSNIRKHAAASRVSLICRQLDADLVLEIHDDGRGFAPEDEPVASQHGLRGMRERADLIGADFQVISQPHQGTTVRVLLPLKDLREVLL